MSRFTRAERLEQIQALVATGLTHRETAERLGISLGGVRATINDPDGSKQLARRVGYGGTCRDCGGLTDGSNGRAKAPTRCRPCRDVFERSDEYRLSRTKWTRELLIERIREWAERYGEPPAMADWNPHQARIDFGDEERARRWEEAGGYWPWTTSVVQRFGNWNDGIAAAGFKPRVGHGGAGNRQRRRSPKAARMRKLP